MLRHFDLFGLDHSRALAAPPHKVLHYYLQLSAEAEPSWQLVLSRDSQQDEDDADYNQCWLRTGVNRSELMRPRDQLLSVLTSPCRLLGKLQQCVVPPRG